MHTGNSRTNVYMGEKEDKPGSKSEVQSALQLYIQDTVLARRDDGDLIYKPSPCIQMFTHAETYVETCLQVLWPHKRQQ